MGPLALAGRILVTILLAVLLVGFGLCGVVGMNAGIEARNGAQLLLLGGLGIAIAVFLAFLIASIWRKRGGPPA